MASSDDIDEVVSLEGQSRGLSSVGWGKSYEIPSMTRESTDVMVSSNRFSARRSRDAPAGDRCASLAVVLHEDVSAMEISGPNRALDCRI